MLISDNQYQKSSKKDLIREISRLKNAVKKKDYGLVWMDIEEAFEKESENKIPVLKEVLNLGIKNNDDKPTHILIEGENYHALTCLNYTHNGKIDVIYIDPPYNTGSDGFRYKDKRKLDKFPDGTDVPKDSPFRHGYWLSFMRKRIELAYSLLKDTGVMFISIDDNELFNLVLLCTDIVKNEDNVEVMIWDKVTGNALAGSGKMKITYRFRRDHEYILVVYKDKNKTKFNKPLEKVITKNDYGNLDGDPRGDWISSEMCKSEIKSNLKGKNYYLIKLPNGVVISRQWHFSKEELSLLDKDKRIYWGGGNIIPRLKRFINEDKPTTPSSVLYGKGSTTDGNNEVKQMGIEFDNPKPLLLIIYLLKLATNNNSVVLDFFAGSGTTGHAVLKLNEELGGKRQFILVTNNEDNIMMDACLPRIRKAIKGYTYNGTDYSVLMEKTINFNEFEENRVILNDILEIEQKNSNTKKWDRIEKKIEKGMLKITGIKNIRGKMSGLGNSFRFYKTAFMGKNNILNTNDEDKTNLAQNAGELLAIAENTLYLKEKSDYWQVFEDKNKYTAIYFREELNKFNQFVKKVSELKGKVVVYIFSWGHEEFTDDFSQLPQVDVKNIPQPILEIYRQIYNLN